MKHNATHFLKPLRLGLQACLALALIPTSPGLAETAPKKAVPKTAPKAVKPTPAPSPFPNPFAPKPAPSKPGAAKAKPVPTKTASAKKTAAKPVIPAKSGAVPLGSPWAKPKSYPMSEVTINHRLLSQWRGPNSRVVVDLGKQKAYLLINGRIAITTPVSSARAGMTTPTGTFRMSERVRTGKISNLYHVGMPFWMRLGTTPYGTHAGHLPGYPASHGCIRLPYQVAEMIFDHTQMGTEVSVHHSWKGV
ncbi:MAG: Lipoprotein-anchoring transpeptidase ErfK/SrfK [Verrucomicrobia bacterium]|jgi:lipoprotein-anchoring transpeptidase ErfK/SrfK|nr:MAG: Lipoprotein-anchoring transpeptidase ErfK/SrfK [Verrucomicrobiota bacterium]